jgi:hypothetical protein
MAHRKNSSCILLLLVLLPTGLTAAEIVGRVTDVDTGLGLADAIVRAIPLSRSEREVHARTGNDGRYQLDLLRGKYRLFVSVPDSDYLSQFYSSSAQPRGDIIDVPTFESFRIIDISLAAGGSITGTVLRSVDMAQVANLRIQAASQSFRTATHTGKDGSYVFRALPPGQYTIRVLPLDENFISVYYADTRAAEKAFVIALNRGQKVSNIDFRLSYGGVISGRIYANRNREPIAGLRVIAENQTRQEPPYFTVTDAQGFYTLRGLTEGSYTLETSASGRRKVQNRSGKSLVMQFHEGRYDRELADRLEVETGSVFTGIDFAMVEAASISGSVYSGYHNRPLPEVLVRSHNIDKAVLNPLHAKTDVQGSFIAANLPPGEYIVDTLVPEEIRRLVNFFYRNKLGSEKADRVNLEEGEHLRNIDFILPMGGTLRGSLKIDDPEHPLKPQGKAVSLKRDEPDQEGFGKKEFKLKADGSFLIERTPPGHYTLAPVLDDPNLIPEANAQERLLQVTEGSLTEGLEFPLKVVGSIAGTVSSQGKSPNLNEVILMLVNLKDNSRTYFELPAENYTVPALEPGRYFMVLLTKPDPAPSPVGLPKGRVFDMRVVEVQRGKTTSGIVLQIPAESNPRP